MKLFKQDNNQYIIMALNTDHDKELLNKCKVPVLKELIGSYKGETESSYLVPDSFMARELAATHDQESILELCDNMATVRTRTGDIMITGKFVNVGTKKPTSDAWTYDIENGNYYVIE